MRLLTRTNKQIAFKSCINIWPIHYKCCDYIWLIDYTERQHMVACLYNLWAGSDIHCAGPLLSPGASQLCLWDCIATLAKQEILASLEHHRPVVSLLGPTDIILKWQSSSSNLALHSTTSHSRSWHAVQWGSRKYWGRINRPTFLNISIVTAN